MAICPECWTGTVLAAICVLQLPLNQGSTTGFVSVSVPAVTFSLRDLRVSPRRYVPCAPVCMQAAGGAEGAGTGKGDTNLR